MKRITLKPVSEMYKEVANLLAEGGLIVFPSDTVYGLLCDASNPKAVEKLLQFKERPPGKAVSVFCASVEMIKEYCEVTEVQEKMLNTLLPGPYTIAVPSKHVLVSKLESEKGTLGVRIPDFKPVNELIERFGKPVTATSANLSGDGPHYSLDSLLASLSEKKKALLDAVVDAGKLPRNKPSTVIDLTREEVTVLRVGETLLDQKQVVISKSEQETKDLAAQLIKQYAKPSKPFVFILKGDLGSGKTIFTKGIAETFNIEDIVSPTFVIYYEYPIKNSEFNNIYHFDLYNITDQEEFEHLGIQKIMKPGNIFVFEWGEKLGNVYSTFQDSANVVYVELEHVSASERRLTVNIQP